MTRRILNLLTLLSLLMCVAGSALWATSYMDRSFVSHRGRLYVWGLRYPEGIEPWLMLHALSDTGRRDPGPVSPILLAQEKDGIGSGRWHEITRDPPRLKLLGAELWFGEAFRPAVRNSAEGVRFWLVAVPCWLLVTAGALLAAAGAIGAFRRSSRHVTAVAAHPLIRRVLNVATALSLLLSLLAATVWADSYMDRHFVSHRGRLYVWGLRYPAGVKAGLVADGLTLEGQRYAKPLRPILVQEQNGDTGGAPITDDPPRLRLLGASLWFGDVFGPANPRWYSPDFAVVRFWLLAMPYWLLAIASAILPTTAAARALRRRSRRRQNRCASCGYDLRGSFDRCPECGEKGSRADDRAHRALA